MPAYASQASQDPDLTIDVESLMRQVVPDADIWKLAANPALGGQRPIDLINTPREQALRDLLRAAKHGMCS